MVYDVRYNFGDLHGRVAIYAALVEASSRREAIKILQLERGGMGSWEGDIVIMSCKKAHGPVLSILRFVDFEVKP